ncbi:MAG: PA14 domain-containing protein [Caldilineaceae bacterium]
MSLLKANAPSGSRFPRAYPPLWTLLVIPLIFILTGCVMPAGPEQGTPRATASPVPVIAVAPANGEPGAQITVASAGWHPGETIYVNVESTQAGKAVATTVAVATADTDGRVNVAFALPADLAKSDTPAIMVVAYSGVSGEKATAPFTLGAVAATGTVTTTLTSTATQTVTETPTATPSPTSAAATPTPTPMNVAHVLLQGLNFRSGPGVGYAIIGNLPLGTKVVVIGQSANAYWLHVQLSDGTDGWVARGYTDFKGTAPVGPTPPLPTAAPVTATPPPLSTATPSTIYNWRGEYFNNRSLVTNPVLVRDDPTIDFDWGSGAPAAGLPSDNFAVRWTRGQSFDAGTYRFHVLVDDGAYLFVDDNLLINEWHDGAARETTADIYLGQGTHNLRVEYYENTGVSRIKVWWEQISPSSDSYPDWKGEYWTNRHLSGDPELTRNDGDINFNWGDGSPDGSIPDDNFSVRWTRSVDFRRGLYRLYARADDGIRVWVDGDRVIDEWHDNHYGDTFTVDLNLRGDTDLRVEYYEHNGGARVKFWWDRIGDQATATPTAAPNPYAKVNPSSGPAGSRLTVSGGGFPANTAVTVYLGGTVRASSANAAPQPYGNGVTDNRGNYSIAFTLPTTWPNGKSLEPGQLVVMVATANFGVQASDTFNLVAPQPTSAAQPYVNINPNSGGLDAAVTVSGGGFPANVRVSLYLAEVAAADVARSKPKSYVSGTTDANGNFSIGWKIPHRFQNGDAIGSGKLVIVVATDNFTVQASATFDYFVGNVPNPALTLAPAAGGPNTTVTVSGGGFPANTPVYAYLALFSEQVNPNNAQLFNSTTTDRNGNYSMSFAMPAVWKDGTPITSDKLIVLVATQDFSVKVTGVFNFTPAPTPTGVLTATPVPTSTPVVTRANPSAGVAPPAGGENTTVVVQGGGFPPNTTVNVHLAGFDGDVNRYGPPVSYGTGTTRTDGGYSLSFTMPRDWPNGDHISSGRLLVIVATNDFSVQASALFDYRESGAANVEATPTAVVMTEAPTATPTQAPADTATAPPPATDTPTPAPPTVAPADTPTPAPTDTPAPAAPAPTDTPTAAPTDTPVPPTAAPTDTPAVVAPPTDTPAPPTATPTRATKKVKVPTATRTPKPAPTDTPAPPPTATPVPAPTDTPAPAPTETPLPPPSESITNTAPVNPTPVEGTATSQ